jgi:hypothetical protein
MYRVQDDDLLSRCNLLVWGGVAEHIPSVRLYSHCCCMTSMLEQAAVLHHVFRTFPALKFLLTARTTYPGYAAKLRHVRVPNPSSRFSTASAADRYADLSKKQRRPTGTGMHETPPTTRLAAVAATQASASSIKISVDDGRATQAPAKPHPRRGNVEKAPNQACGSLLSLGLVPQTSRRGPTQRTLAVTRRRA